VLQEGEDVPTIKSMRRDSGPNLLSAAKGSVVRVAKMRKGQVFLMCSLERERERERENRQTLLGTMSIAEGPGRGPATDVPSRYRGGTSPGL